MRYLIHSAFDAGALGLITLGACAVALLAALALLVNAPRTRPRRPLRTLYRSLGVACAALAIAAAQSAILFRRAHDFMLKPGEPPASLYVTPLRELRAFSEIVEQAEATLQLTAYAALGASCLVILAAILTRIGAHKKLRARRLLPWTAALAGAELTAAVAVAVLRRYDAIDVSSHCYSECRELIAVAAAHVLGDARLHIALATGVAFFLLTRAVRRSVDVGHAPFGRRASVAGVALFSLGLLAFISTRTMASDASRELPPQDKSDTCPDPSIATRSLPPAPAAPSQVTGSAVSQFSSGIVVELALPCANLYGACFLSPAELVKDLDAKRRLWRSITPNRRMPPITVAARSEAPLQSLAPWLLELRRADFSAIEILLAHPPEHFATETLGLVERTPRCSGARANLDELELAISLDFTWGDLAASHQAQ